MCATMGPMGMYSWENVTNRDSPPANDAMRASVTTASLRVTFFTLTITNPFTTFNTTEYYVIRAK